MIVEINKLIQFYEDDLKYKAPEQVDKAYVFDMLKQFKNTVTEHIRSGLTKILSDPKEMEQIIIGLTKFTHD